MGVQRALQRFRRGAAQKLKLDLFYIKNANFVFDLVILMQTLEVVIWGRAISMAGSLREPLANVPARDGSRQVPLFPAEKRDVA